MFVNSNRFRSSHQASADAILLPLGEQRRVKSVGSRFFNVDHWVGRAFITEMTTWAKLNPGQTPTREVIETWVARANAKSPYITPEITIAATPDELPLATALALAGGVYHEALHTVFSRRKPLTVEDVEENVLSRWDLVPSWAKSKFLLEMSNLIEDVRIERLGNAKYPGIRKELCNLEDLVVNQEFSGLEKAQLSKADVARFVTMATFRSHGLGYKSPTQTVARLKYKQMDPAAYENVMSGGLRHILDLTLALTAQDDMACLWLAMDFYCAIFNPEEQEAPQPEQGQDQGQGQGAGEDEGEGASDGQGQGQGQGKGKDSTRMVEFESVPESWVREYQGQGATL